jgi:hypothetical protein
MTDKELLELAAKAAGIKIIRFTDTGWALYVDKNEDGKYWQSWNPLDSDGDALRLAVKLHMTIDRSETRPAAYVYCDWRDECDIQAIEPYNDDPCAATRRAIVRAAADIGLAMKEECSDHT